MTRISVARRKRKKPEKGHAPQKGTNRDSARSDHSGRGPATDDRLRPWLLAATIALFVARPLFPSESVAVFGDGLPVVMLWIAVAVFWLLGAIGRKQVSFRFGLTDVPVVLLVAWHTVAGLRAVWHGAPRPALNVLWQWIGFCLSYLMVRQLVRTTREARAAIAVMVALAVALSGYGLYQYAYELPATRAEYQRDPDQQLRDAGLWFEPGSPERELFEKRLMSVEPPATFALANSLAGYLAPWLTVAVAIGVAGLLPGGQEGAVPVGHRLWNGLGSAACVLPAAVCLLLTKSRSAYLATGLGVVLAIWFCRPWKFALGWKLPAAIILVGSMLLAAATVSGGLDIQVVSEAGKSLGYRLEYWEATAQMIARVPLFGCGPGNFRYAYTRYKLPQASEEIGDPHNFLLEVWSTAGTPAALALVAVLGCWYWSLRRGSRPKRDGTAGTTKDAAAFVLLGGVAGFVFSLPLGVMSSAPPGMVAVLIGLPLAAASIGLLWPWIQAGRLPLSLLAIGLTALLVNLLAAGGIGFPGVAGTMWLMMALGLNVAEVQSGRTVPRGAPAAALAAGLAIALACYASAYAPVLKATASMRRAQRDLPRAEQHLKSAAAADSLWAKPRRQLAAVALEGWLAEPTSRKFAEFQDHVQAALKLIPGSAAAWFEAGEQYFRAFERTGQTSEAQAAVRAYRQAVDLYPTRSLYRARLAVALMAAGDADGFRQQADEALRLDEITPHADKKLPDELRSLLVRRSSNSG
jgi:O-antigen ligase